MNAKGVGELIAPFKGAFYLVFVFSIFRFMLEVGDGWLFSPYVELWGKYSHSFFEWAKQSIYIKIFGALLILGMMVNFFGASAFIAQIVFAYYLTVLSFAFFLKSPIEPFWIVWLVLSGIWLLIATLFGSKSFLSSVMSRVRRKLS